MAEKIVLTEDRIRTMMPPDSGERFLWDSKISGFGVRCFPSGRKVYILMYRVAGGGRAATRQRITIAEVNKLPLAKARSIAQGYNGEIADGADPRARLREQSRRQVDKLNAVLDAYERYLKRRHVVNRAQCMSALRRGMPQPLDKIDITQIDRRTIAERIEKISPKGRASVKTKSKAGETVRVVGGPVAAAQFRTFAHTFFSWAAEQGYIVANPIAGWRRPRTTRAQMVHRPGRALADGEIKAVWAASGAGDRLYGDFVRFLLLSGQRRTETSKMRWIDLDLDSAVWTIPAAVAKNGRQHSVPLPPAAAALLLRQERHVGSDYVFAGRGGVPMSGWSKRQAALKQAAGCEFKLHDLRKTFRSGLSRLGVDPDLAEMMLNHMREDLIETYDLEPRLAERRLASQQWAEHIASITVPAHEQTNVIELRTAVP